VSVQFLRQQAIIDVCVSWREDLRFAAETHHRAIPILQFARLAVGNVALQGRSAAGWRASGSGDETRPRSCGALIDMRDLSQLLAHVHDAEIEIWRRP